MVKVISQHIDTLKTHYYIAKTIEDKSFHDYLKIVDSLISLKKEAQEVKNNYGNERSVNYQFGDERFNVMATAISGFSVVMKNNDVSIALRKTKNKINHSPVIKVEFRAEYLARKGYKKCIALVNSFVSTYLLEDFKIKISEIHLATDLQGYNFSHLDFYRMKTRSRNPELHEEDTDYGKSSAFGSARIFSGFTYGGGDYRLRLYDKTLEINKFKNKAFAKTLLWEHKPDYNPSVKVWRIEIQIRRAKLKKLVNFENSTMDDYDNILGAIPDLWKKALTDYTIKAVSDDDIFSILRGYRLLKNGTQKILTKNSMYATFKRAEGLPFWEDIKSWNDYQGKQINTAFKIPQSAKEYVSNSIKSVFSTMGRHYGAIDAQTLVKAFKEANEDNILNKGVSLIEDSIVKQLDYFEKVDFLIDNGVCSVPSYKDLEQSIYNTVYNASENIYDVAYSDLLKDKLEARRAFSGFKQDSVHFENYEHSRKYMDKLEAGLVFSPIYKEVSTCSL